jgi:virginiamycin B lyase
VLTRYFSRVAAAAFAVLLIQTISATDVRAQAATALAGQVTSAEEGPMEGVVVSAKKQGSTITVSVITDDQGGYSFPANRLEPGQHAISIRAVGYDLEGPRSAEIVAGLAATADLKLRKTRNVARQLTNAEWMMSAPGTDDQKMELINCVSCHTLERVVKSAYNADELVAVITRMNTYAQSSTTLKPQRRIDMTRASNPERFRKAAEYISTINLSQGPNWSYELKTLPRVKGRGTRAIITEYDLPRQTIAPHDVIMVDGTIWYSNFDESYLGRLDPKTGNHTEYAMAVPKPNFPVGTLDIGVDRNGHIWLGMMYQAAVAKFDPKTEQFQYFNLPAERNRDNSQLNMVTPDRLHVDGKLWVNDAGPSTLLRLDVATGKYEEFDPLSMLPGGPKGGYSIYDVRADSKNNAYVTDFQRNYVVRVDAKTGQFTAIQTGSPVTRNRRGRIDDLDRFWFAQYRGNHISMLDTREWRIQDYPLPTRFTSPYDVIWDRNGEIWTSGMSTDRVVRLDPDTGRAIEYPLPRPTNVRRVFIDNTTERPTFWTGSNHGASIIKLEPLD